MRFDGCVLNIPMSQIELNGASVFATIGELVSAGVEDHVRMDREKQLSNLPWPAHELSI